MPQRQRLPHSTLTPITSHSHSLILTQRYSLFLSHDLPYSSSSSSLFITKTVLLSQALTLDLANLSSLFNFLENLMCSQFVNQFMAKSRQKLTNQDSLLSPAAARSREWDGPSRWADYLGTNVNSPLSSTSSRNFNLDGQSQGNTPSQSHKGLNMQWVVQLTDVAEGLMAKMYRLNQLLDYPDPINHVFSDGFWKVGVFPNHPRI